MFPIRERWSEKVPLDLAGRVGLHKQLERSAPIPMPSLDRVDAMPARDLALAKKEIDRRRQRAPVRSWPIAKRLAKMATFRMQLQAEFGNEAIGLAHSA